MVVDLDKFAETVIKSVQDSEVLRSPQHQHKDYVIKENFIKHVVYDDDAIEVEDKSVVFFRNSNDDIGKCVSCLIRWDFDSVLRVRIYKGFINKSAPENFHVIDDYESFYVTWFQEIISKIIEGIL